MPARRRPPNRGAPKPPVYREPDADARRSETPPSMPGSPLCTFCGGHDTEIMNAFGSHASVSTYWCRTCGSPFELMKWR
jgi:ring-1,2-phenylacetyl-CoA epoxidase subunit PaaD